MMADSRKPEGTEQCCTVKVVVDKSGEGCCSEAKGERVIKVVCCPEEKKAEE
jgi:hypothetical protein